jgi:tRNA(fMet)-specific endonuclease VapC
VNGEYLLDTNLAIAVLKRDPAIQRRLKGVVLFLCTTVVGELYFGAFNSTEKARNLDALRQYLSHNQVLHADETTAERYGQIKTQLIASGEMIPENDIWIAATALQYDLTLATRDDHFTRVQGLRLENW